jgi:hypothetical protein
MKQIWMVCDITDRRETQCLFDEETALRKLGDPPRCIRHGALMFAAPHYLDGLSREAARKYLNDRDGLGESLDYWMFRHSALARYSEAFCFIREGKIMTVTDILNALPNPFNGVHLPAKPVKLPVKRKPRKWSGKSRLA